MTFDTKLKKRTPPLIGIFVIFILIFPALLFPKEISDGIIFGIRLCVFNIIPSIFPFFIIADAVLSLSGSLTDSFFGKIFSKIFNVPKEAFGAFILGNVCGFPLGVKATSDLYLNGSITKKEAERLIGFSNNPSCAFVITAVGFGMFGSIKTGILLYISVIISAVLTGFLFRDKCKNIKNNKIISRQKFNFVSSVKNAGFSCVTVSSYIIFFSAVSGLILNLFGSGIIGLIGVMLSEVSGAASFISSMPFFEKNAALILTAVALAFSGFSVHLQARSLAAPEISFIKYYVMKITQSGICGCIAFLLLRFL